VVALEPLAVRLFSWQPRVLAENPSYSMVLLCEALDSGAPPSMAELPMTPEEVAAAYDAAEAEEDDDDPE
jgi:hypothetical protein